jgi:hypothetical protein
MLQQIIINKLKNNPNDTYEHEQWHKLWKHLPKWIIICKVKKLKHKTRWTKLSSKVIQVKYMLIKGVKVMNKDTKYAKWTPKWGLFKI